MSLIVKAIKHPAKAFRVLCLNLLNSISPFINNDEFFLKIKYRLIVGKSLNLGKPTLFCEKLQWLKLYDRQEIYPQMVDKIEAKQYVSGLIGDEYIIPTLATYNRAEDIDFGELPNQFVLKCTHDSNDIIICKNKNQFDIPIAVKKLQKGLKNNFYSRTREWPYKNVTPRIIAEKYMQDSKGQLNDYKVMCFGGVPKLIQVHLNRFNDNHTQDFYDTEWNKTDITQGSYGITSDILVPKPECLDDMLRLSSILSSNMPQGRIDWYIINGHLFFGEISFFDASGFCPFDSNKDEELLGSWITLPNEIQNNSNNNDLGCQGIDMFY